MTVMLTTLRRGLEMLSLFTRQRPEWTVAEMSRQLGIPVPTAYRVANTLLAEGFLERSEVRGPVRLGTQVAKLGWIAQESNDLRRLVRPYLLRLVEESGETAALLVPRHSAAACIDRVEGTSSIRPTTLTIGQHVPYNGAALPLALLAFMPEEDRERVLERPLRRLSEATLVDPAAVRRRCRNIREQGWSFSENEAIPGAAGLGVPIFGVGDKLQAVIGFTGIIGRVTVSGQGRMLREAGRAISMELGADLYPGERS